MKSIKYSVPTALLLSFCLVGVTFAQTTDEVRANNRAEAVSQIEAARADVAANRLETQTSRTEAVEVRQAEAQEQRAERRVALSQQASERITTLTTNINNRLSAAVARLQNIIDRLSSRIDKLEAAGLDVSEARVALSAAQLSVNTAANTLATINSTVLTAVNSEDPRSSWIAVKSTYQTVGGQLRNTRTQLDAVITVLKNAARQSQTAPVATPTSQESEPEPTTDDTEAALPVE